MRIKITDKLILAFERIIIYAILGMVAFWCVYPFLIVVSKSFAPTTSIFTYPPEWIPKNPTLQSYVTMLGKGYKFPRWFLNTIIVVGTIITLKLFMDSLAGYTFAKKKFPGKEIIFFLMLSTVMIPFVVKLIPTFLIVRDLGVVDTYWALIIPPLANPIGIFMMRQFMQTLPGDIEDAARIDGCSEFGIYWRVILPISKPGLIALATYIFIVEWTSFIWPLVATSSEEMVLLTVGISTMKSVWVTNWAHVTAASTLSVVPALILFMFLHKHFVSGMTLGALKQ